MSDRDFMTLSRPAAQDVDYGASMLALLNELHQETPRRSALALIRHSARHYGQAENDLDNPLSDEGRAYCRAFGAGLPAWDRFATRSSTSGRCVETAELIGASHMHPRAEPNRVLEDLTVFYVRDMRKVGGMMKHLGPQETLRRWFADEVAPEIMMRPAQARDRLVAALLAMLRESPADQLTLCVSHDWNIYLLRHMVLELVYGKYPPAAYLDGFAFWLDGDRLMAASEISGVRRI